MKWGKHQKMVSVRDLLRGLRAHSAVAIGTSVAVVTVVCGAVAANVLGVIETDAAAIETQAMDLNKRMQNEANAVKTYADALYVHMDDVLSALDTMEDSIVSSKDAVHTIERTVSEITSIDEPVKEAFLQVMSQMETVRAYIAEDREPVQTIIQMTGTENAIRPEDKKTLESLETQVRVTTPVVTRHYTMLAADVGAVVTKLRMYAVKAKPFSDALRTLEENFALGMGGVKLAKEALEEDTAKTDETTTLMLAQLKLSMNGMDTLTESMDASGETMESLYKQVQQSNEVIAALQDQIVQNGAQLSELTAALSSMQEEVRMMQAAVTGAVLAGEAGREEALRLGLEQLAAFEEAADRQKDALDKASEDQKTQLEKATLAQKDAYNDASKKQQEALDQAMENQKTQLEEASARQEQMLEDAAKAQQETLEQSGISSFVRGEDYVTVTFTFDLHMLQGGYTFDFSKYLSNYNSITSKDILVRNFYVSASGHSDYDAVAAGTLNMDQAAYDPATGKLSVTQKLMNAQFGTQSGRVTFAVLGGILK